MTCFRSSVTKSAGICGGGRVRQSYRELFSSKDFCSDVRPEFLKNVIQDSGFHLSSKVPGCFARAALLRRIVGASQAGFQRIAAYFGPVKSRASGIFLRDEGHGYRVGRSAKKASLTHRVVARILVGHRGHDGLGKKSPRDTINNVPPIVTSITGGSVAELRVGI